MIALIWFVPAVLAGVGTDADRRAQLLIRRVGQSGTLIHAGGSRKTGQRSSPGSTSQEIRRQNGLHIKCATRCLNTAEPTWRSGTQPRLILAPDEVYCFLRGLRA
jgi:hypothetical protein